MTKLVLFWACPSMCGEAMLRRDAIIFFAAMPPLFDEHRHPGVYFSRPSISVILSPVWDTAY
ncbi:MAG: hypothetical protein HOP17_01220 [Acidobacteria bacterium]|nr:hypothetical protein [Acidobacteriota bacterium]